MYLMSEERFVPKDEPLRKVSKKKLLLWLALQGLGVAATVAISQTIAAIGELTFWSSVCAALMNPSVRFSRNHHRFDSAAYSYHPQVV